MGREDWKMKQARTEKQKSLKRSAFLFVSLTRSELVSLSREGAVTDWGTKVVLERDR